MHRRDALKIVGGAVAFSTLGGRVTARESYAPLGTVDIAGAKEAVVNEDGTTAYVAATDGFAIVDVSDPADPTLLSEERNLLADRDDGPLQQIYDVKHETDRLVVAGPANGKRGEVVHGFLLYDVSDPKNPKRVAFHETEHAIHNCFFADGTVYLTGNDGEGNPLVTVDVRGDSPGEVGRWSILDHDEAWGSVDAGLRTLHDVWVQDGTAYLAHWDAGVWVVDVSDPKNPSHVADFGGVPREELAGMDSDERFAEMFEPPGNAHYVTVNDDATLLAVGAESSNHPDTPETGGPSGINLWDVSDPANPAKRATIEPPVPGEDGPWTTAHNLELRNGKLYSSWYGGGVKLHDVSDPTDPEQLAWWRKPSETSFWTARAVSEEFFVASDVGVRRDGTDAALYTFPNRAGRQANPPALGPNTSTPADGSGADPARTEPTTTNGRETTGTTASDGQPGFGALAALSGLALGAWRLRNHER